MFFPKKTNSMMLTSLVVLAVLSSCAGKTVVDENAPELALSEAAAVEDSEKNSGTNVFSDLKSPDQSADSSTADSPFYNSIGGEKIGRIAYTLYGKKSFSKILLKKNPGISAGAALAAGEKVYFDFEGANPQPKYLTKDLLDRYSAQLAEHLLENANKSGLQKVDAVLNKGETLQALSTRLYGSSRFWPEIFLLNHSKVGSYDKVRAGTSLVVLQRAVSAAPQVAATTDSLKPVVEEKIGMGVLEPVLPSGAPVGNLADTGQKEMNTQAPLEQAAPMDTKPVVKDPIPETPMAKPVDTQKVEIKQEEPSPGIHSANTRRVLYLVMVASIMGLGFILTRTKKKKTFDMLDANADAAAPPRPKLNENHKNIIG